MKTKDFVLIALAFFALGVIVDFEVGRKTSPVGQGETIVPKPMPDYRDVLRPTGDVLRPPEGNLRF